MDLVTLVETLAEDEGISECRPSRCDVDRATSGEVEGREIKQPTVSIELLASIYLICC